MLNIIAVISGGMLFSVCMGLCDFFLNETGVRSRRILSLDTNKSDQIYQKLLLNWIDQIQAPSFLRSSLKEDDWFQADLSWGREQILSSWWVLILIGFCSGGFIIMIVPVLKWGFLIGSALIIGSFVGPPAFIRMRIAKRRKAVEDGLPYFLDMLALSLEAGLGFLPALKRVRRGIKEPFKSEVCHLIEDFSRGYTKRAALDKLIERTPSESIVQFSQAVMISDRLGTSLARTIRIQAALFRAQRRRQAETRAKTAPIRIIPALVFFFLPALLLIYLAPPILKFLQTR